MFLRRKFLNEVATSERAAIAADIAQVFATRRGSHGVLPYFGFTDTGYRTPAEMIAGLSAEIRQNIALYEPRLGVVEIEDQYLDDGRVQLCVHCRIRSTDERMQIVMDSQGNLLRIAAAVGEESVD